MKENRKPMITVLRCCGAVLSVVALYIVLILFSGMIVGGDIGNLETEIPGFVFFVPIILTLFGVFCGYYTKKKNDSALYLCFLIPLLIPAVVYPLMLILMPVINETPLLGVLMFPAMPATSLFTALVEAFDDLGMKSDLLSYIISAVLLAVGILSCPVAHRLTKATENQA